MTSERSLFSSVAMSKVLMSKMMQKKILLQLVTKTEWLLWKTSQNDIKILPNLWTPKLQSNHLPTLLKRLNSQLARRYLFWNHCFVSGLKASLKTKKFYGSNSTAEDVAGETVISEADFKTIFDSFGTTEFKFRTLTAPWKNHLWCQLNG